MRARRKDREIAITTAALGAGALLGAGAMAAAHGIVRARGAQAAAPEEAEVTPAEDLMREHGVLRRVLLVYGEITGRIEQQAPAPLDALTDAAGIVRRFVEAYHEEIEERFVFPVFLKAGVLVDLVNVLWDQHRAGKRVTEAILRRAQTGEGVAELPGLTRAFSAMYRAHAAREDTVLFPALRGLVGARAYAEMGERFEEMERAALGSRGFEGAVDEVARLEERLGTHDLAKLTPR